MLTAYTAAEAIVPLPLPHDDTGIRSAQGKSSGFIADGGLGGSHTNGHCPHESTTAVQSILGAVILGELQKGDAGGAVIVKQQAALGHRSCKLCDSSAMGEPV